MSELNYCFTIQQVGLGVIHPSSSLKREFDMTNIVRTALKTFFKSWFIFIRSSCMRPGKLWPDCVLHRLVEARKVNEYDQEKAQSHTTDQPTARHREEKPQNINSF